MNKSSWKQIEEGLRSRKSPPPHNDSESFMQDFKARASLMRQTPVEAPSISRIFISGWRYIGVTAAALLMLGYFFWPAQSTLVTQVKSLQILAPHSGVIIMTDEDNSGTVVWVTDLEADDGSKG